jgi:hypothetical protein
MYPSGVATHTERIAATVQLAMVSLNAAPISGLLRAAPNSEKEVKLRSATISNTINKINDDESPPMMRKNTASLARRVGF